MGGGTTGNVVYPRYISDVHAWMIGGFEVTQQGSWDNKPWTKPNRLLFGDLTSTLWATNPYQGFTWTDPATDLAASEAQFNLFYNGVTSYDRANYADYIGDAILAIGNSTTVPIAELAVALSTSPLVAPETSYQTYIGSGRTTAVANLTRMFGEVQADVRALMIDVPSTALAAVSLTAATTMWDSLVDTVSTKLQTCGIPKNANLLTVLTKAAQDAEQNLRTAITLTKKFIDDDILSDVSNQFASRREIAFSSQHRQFAGQMADLNAINSTGFLFGTALLKAEQMREVGEFDANLSLAQFQQGLASYLQIHGQALTAGLGVEQQNAQAHNRLLEASIQLLSQLTLREEITPANLIGLYGQFFAAELGMFESSLKDSTNVPATLFGVTSGDQLARDTGLTQFTLDADKTNKVAKEQRFQLGMRQIQGLLTNRSEFERMAAEVLTDQNRLKIVATREYDAIVNDTEVQEDLWDINVFRQAADILVAPGGMGAAIPSKPTIAESVLGGIFKGASIIASSAGGGG